jgi:O-antigen/teichoic acid export membrane protein
MQSGSLHRNSRWLLLARFSVQSLAVVFVALIARRLGIHVFGQFSVIASLVLIGNTLTTFGTDTLIIREVAKAGRITNLVTQSLGLQLSLSTLWWLATFMLFHNPPLWLYMLSLFPLAFFSVASALTRAFQRMDLFWALNLGNGTAQLMAGLLSKDIWTLCVYLLLGQIAVAFFAIWLCRRYLREFPLRSLLDFRHLWKFAWPFAALTTLTIASQRLGILSVSAMIGDAGAGMYSAAARLVDGMKFGHYAVLGALLPMLSAGNLGVRNDFRNGFRSMILFSASLAGIVSLLAKPITLLFYGDEFENAASLLTYICWSIIPYTVSSFIAVDLVARGKETSLLKASILSMSIFAILFVLFIFWSGLTGAAYAALIGETIQAAIFIRSWRSGNRRIPEAERHTSHG